ncbi:MAG: RNA polymerase sigma factor [Ruminococcus sp.]|nr:RNA polymerase sigma factor [Ruminococcus sp.]
MNGIDEKFGEVYELTKHSTLRYISSKCLRITDIEDIYQETYLSIYNAIKNGADIRDPESYVISTARHCISHYYTAAQKLKARISLSAGSVSDEPVDIGNDTDIEQLIADRTLLDDIFAEICALPSEVQRIFYLHYFLELSLPEISALMGIPEGKVSHRLYRAVRQLRRKYRGGK